MKTFLLLFTLSLGFFTANSQAVLNEVYTDPSSGKHEFFELYNTSTSATPESLDNYTLVTYYEEGSRTGFYVLDMPNFSINARGFFVGASSLIFNVQSQSNLIANFSWNLIPISGSLTKWERSGTSYISKAVPLGLNDLFNRTSGSGGSYHIFLFKNGVMVNALIAAISGMTIPAYIKSMPSLPVDMSGSSPDFTIDFAGMTDSQAEYVIPSVGTDNGYMRLNDGLCGAWEKSSSSGEHTPGLSNGSPDGVAGLLTIVSSISYGSLPSDPSVLKYNITAGPSYLFPVTMEAYRDFGTPGVLDPADILFDSRVIANTTAGVQSITLINPYDNVLLIAKTAAGCFDKITKVVNYRAVLPVTLTSFTAALENTNTNLRWTIEAADQLDYFAIERSTDGVQFVETGRVYAEESVSGKNKYQFADDLANVNASRMYYRLRSVDLDAKSSVSDTRMIILTKTITNSITIQAYPNPVSHELRISIPANWQNKKVVYEVFAINGIPARKTESANASQTETLNVSSLGNGFYMVRVSCDGQSAQQKFVKN